MELRQLRVFDAVVRGGTVAAAALTLGLAPSSVSEQVRTLESALGVPLFDRTPRGMRPTPAGERLVGWARQLLELAERARDDVAGPAEPLRLGALETVTAVWVPRVLARLADRRPHLDVHVRSSASRDDLLAAVVAGGLDAALLLDTGTTLGGLGFPPPPEPLEFLDVAPVPLRLVAAPDHPLLGRPLGTADLAGERLLVNVAQCSFALAADALLGPAPRRVPVGSVQVMRAWAEQGLGIALLPGFAVEAALAAGTLAALDLPTPPLSLRLVWRGDRETRPGLRDVLYAASG